MQTGNKRGYLVTFHAFMEFADRTEAWQKWAQGSELEEEHALFFSAMTYGGFQFKNRISDTDESESVKNLFRRFRNSALNARIIPVESQILDAAAMAFGAFHHDGELEDSNWMLAYIELATAARWDLIPLCTKKQNDKLAALMSRVDGEWEAIDLS